MTKNLINYNNNPNHNINNFMSSQKTQCKHSHINITRISQYFIPNGWLNLKDDDDIDLAEYFIQEDETIKYCNDCCQEI